MKRVWLINHYATNTFFDRGGRHYNFAKELTSRGYDVSVICANTVHNSEKIVDTSDKDFRVQELDGIHYTFIKVPPYKGNGMSRAQNMLSFALKLVRNTNELLDKLGKPQLILASSVHPLTCIAGIRMGKNLQIPVISEIRDLWPETIIAMGKIGKSGVLARVLYAGEKYIYKHSDAVIFTMEGGPKYVRDQGWNNRVNLDKLFYVNNGVVLSEFEKNKCENTSLDTDLLDQNKKSFVYCGSLREANNVGKLIDAFQNINTDKGQLLIWGAGEQEEMLRNKVKNERINNVVFKGRVAKNEIPSIVSQAYVNILHYGGLDVFEYGMSQNKLFEYLAAGKPVLGTCPFGFNIIEKYKCGLTASGSLDSIENMVRQFVDLPDSEYNMYCANSRKAAQDFDFVHLTDKLEEVFKYVLNKKK